MTILWKMTFPVDQKGSTTLPFGDSEWTNALTSDKLLPLQHAVLQQHMPPPENNEAEEEEEEAATNSIAGKVTNFATYVRRCVIFQIRMDSPY